MIKQITAKSNLSSYWNKVYHEWIAGRAYSAEFNGGNIILESENGKHCFNGIQKDQIYENFIFWGE